MASMTARQRVLASIGRRGTASAAQIGQALSMSAATVRHHLSILVGDGRVVATGATSKGKRGRPEILYRLSDRMAGENLALLSDIALKGWFGDMAESEREAAIQFIAEQLRQHIGTADNKLPAQKRMVALVDRLNQLHYRARWEAGAAGPRILFGNCPYAAIIQQHPELCTMDASMLAGEMSAQVEQLSKIRREVTGPSQCVFAVRQQPKAGD